MKDNKLGLSEPGQGFPNSHSLYWEDGLGWEYPQFSRAEVNRAGDTLSAPEGIDIAKAGNAWRVFSNWRSSHSYPLNHFQTVLRQKAKRIQSSAIIAQRLKRAESIVLKLSCEKNMKLSQMQDIGGCRAVLNNIHNVQELARSFNNSRWEHKLHNSKDYLVSPKDSGYRGIHLIYRYCNPAREHYEGLRIEIQLRTELQHHWATAVELVQAYTMQSLKKSSGDKSWLRFFRLMGTYIAIKEGTAPVPDTPVDQEELRRELFEAIRDTHAIPELSSYRNFTNITKEYNVHGKYFLIVTDYKAKQVKYQGFGADQLVQAQEAYLNIEQKIRDDKKKNAVLVSVDNIKHLRRAYPNYFSDASSFVALVREALGLVKE
jgi:hypothetical protein